MKNSIFIKMFLIIVASGVLLNVGVTHLVFRRPPPPVDRLVRNGERYLRYLIPDLGEAPTFAKGKALANDLSVEIRIEGQGWSWKSSETAPEIEEMPDRFPGKGKGPGPFVVIDYNFPKAGPAKVLLLAPRGVQFRPPTSHLFILVALISVVLLVIFFMIRWVLSPVKSFEKAIAAISGGDLSTEVTVNSTDELGRLGGAFNGMVKRIRQMISDKEQLLLDVSHELRSPLARAKIAVELMEHSPMVDIVTRELDEIESMIHELLESSRLGSGHGQLKQERINLADLVSEVVGQYSHVDREIDVNIQDAYVSADKLRLGIVVKNILDNALKHSPAETAVKVSLEQTGGEARLTVTDRGTGIPQSELKRVFEPFYRVDKSRDRKTGGFGLGLSLAYKIVVAHGGTIRLESEEGKGTTAIVILPA